MSELHPRSSEIITIGTPPLWYEFLQATVPDISQWSKHPDARYLKCYIAYFMLSCAVGKFLSAKDLYNLCTIKQMLMFNQIQNVMAWSNECLDMFQLTNLHFASNFVQDE